MRVLTAFVVCCFLLAACSSGSGKSTTTKTIGNSVPPTDPPTTPSAPIPVSACSLVPDATVTALLGVAAKGTESDPQPVNRNCEWDTTPATAGAQPSKLIVGLIRIGNGYVGYGPTLVGFTAQVLTGVGDTATYSSGKTSTGSEERLVVTNKGTVSLSVAAVYASPSVPPDSVQDQLTSLAEKIFTKVHA